jgi:hypothetical protein
MVTGGDTMAENKPEEHKEKLGSISSEDINKLISIIETVSYGSITILIQDGKIVQIEKNEKIRLK